MPGEASWIPLGWIISSSCAKLSCWEPASLSGNSLHTSSPPTCTFCAQCIPLRCACPLWREVVIYYHCNKYGCVLAGPWAKSNPVLSKGPSTVTILTTVRGGKSSSCTKLSCWEPASLSGSSLHTSLSLCTSYSSPEVPAHCTVHTLEKSCHSLSL